MDTKDLETLTQVSYVPAKVRVFIDFLREAMKGVTR